ncbi:DNA repair protein RecO [Sediminibacillus massiliensis]|uniref:DNA repair protein RecO n=1 Tax=Sediminibacillus massiliensis TaxID=1926277 RepID=UPI0009882EB1|nr:DNA repair protein RecO [Sediminibacillus massiliensis]
MFEKVEGVILRTRDYGETHKIVTILTKQFGKISAIARGAKKPKSRMAAVTQPFIHGQFLLQLGSGLGSLQQGEVLASLRPIREDIIKTAYATYLAELTDKLLDEKQPDLFIYKQLLNTFQWISEDKDAEVLTIIYELKMYRKAGFAPNVKECVNCGNPNGPFSFSISEGGYLCPRCRYLDGEAVPLSERLSKVLFILSEIDTERVGNISIKPENKELLKQLMEAYYDRYGGYYIKSKNFLKQLDMLK